MEEPIREELGDYVDEALGELAGSDSYELGFDPVEPKGPVSLFVRETRDERAWPAWTIRQCIWVRVYVAVTALCDLSLFLLIFILGLLTVIPQVL